MAVSNILDPIKDTLDPTVWDDAGEAAPLLKPQHKVWITETIFNVLAENGYTAAPEWLELVLTGSLTTYQYSDESDCDVSLFVNVDKLPEWSRAEMIAIMVDNVDGTILPGTTHPMQCFVVQSGVRPEDLYKPGLRSGYSIMQDRWIVPPERSRVHDVKAEYNGFYTYALEVADKMDRLLRYEPDKAVDYWHQIHSRRQRDQKAGKGDYSESNIVYKFLAQRGLLPQIAQQSGEYIAKAAGILPDPDMVEQARQQLGLQKPVRFLPTFKLGTRGGYAGTSRDPRTGEESHLIYFQPSHPGAQNWAAWHELAHALQNEQGQTFTPTTEMSAEQYSSHPKEQHAEQVAAQYADMDLWNHERTSAELWTLDGLYASNEEGY